jgi:hypothetical protein
MIAAVNYLVAVLSSALRGMIKGDTKFLLSGMAGTPLLQSSINFPKWKLKKSILLDILFVKRRAPRLLVNAC